MGLGFAARFSCVSFWITALAMHLTVAICTWNRADLLDDTLASLATVAIPGGVTWEVIVANNNSTDHTDAVLARHASQLPLRRLFVAQQGKSYALNAVIERLTGDLVLWTDDDVRVAGRLDRQLRGSCSAVAGGGFLWRAHRTAVSRRPSPPGCGPPGR